DERAELAVEPVDALEVRRRELDRRELVPAQELGLLECRQPDHRKAPITAPPATTSTAPATSRRPISSLRRSTSAATRTPHTDSVATIGDTTVTRPWKYASKSATYEIPKRSPAGTNATRRRAGGRRRPPTA